MTAHAKFSPSSLKRLMACPASYGLSQAAATDQGPRKAFGAAWEGTTAHALAELCLLNHLDPRAMVGKPLEVDCDGQAHTVEVEKEMADLVAIYVDHCRTLAMLADSTAVEHEVHVTTTINGHPCNDLLWGTADFVAFSPDRIDVVDLKFGGMAVDPEDNPQLVAYLLGALELLPSDQRPNRGAVHIVQPKLSAEPKIWEIDDLKALRVEWLHRFERTIDDALRVALLACPPEEFFGAGAHCHFCPALATCDHFAQSMIEITTAELEEIQPEGKLFSNRYEALVERWKAKSLVTRYYQALEEKLADELRKGADVPGLKIVESLGNRKWAYDDKSMESRLRTKGLKKKDFIKEALISPAQAEKLIDDKEALAKWVVREKSEKLALASDKRPAVNHALELEVIEPSAPIAPEPVEELRPSALSPLATLVELGVESEPEPEVFEIDLGEEEIEL